MKLNEEIGYIKVEDISNQNYEYVIRHLKQTFIMKFLNHPPQLEKGPLFQFHPESICNR